MPKSAARVVFATPKLFLSLLPHLTPHDLAQCLRVCKGWLHLLEPILWMDFCLEEPHDETLSDTRPSPMKDALIRNLPYIRTVKCSVANVALLQVLTNGSSTDSSTPCTQLKRLEIKEFNNTLADLTSRYLATLLDLNRCLTQLELPIEFTHAKAVSASLSKLESLQRLTAGHCWGGEGIVLLENCLPLPSLTQLFIDLDMRWSYYEHRITLETVIEEASIARFSRDSNAARIKSLQLPSNRNGDGNPLPLLLLKSELLDLEFCEIPWFDREHEPDDLSEVAREHCPNLKHLTCPSFKDHEDDGNDVAAFIKGCSGLRSFDSDRFSDHDQEGDARRIIWTLAAHHSDTLEVFELTDCHQVFSHDQQAILSRCKQLKRFWVMSSTPYDSNIGITYTDILRGKWVCMELTKLSLTLNRQPLDDDTFGELEDEEGDQEEEGAEEGESAESESEEDCELRLISIAAKSVYTRIGRLQKLEVLALSIDISQDTAAEEKDYAWDLTLSNGWLGEMAGLKNLKTLMLHAAFWSKMGQAEVEFMHERWPLLSAIYFNGNALTVQAQPHWQWLRSQRPHLLYNYQFML
ncbi:hypothetical protein BGZ70_003088 [Mortierella alpina]|uniref:F-box domain-containing protein n=1 Tax=Mortierella alpina TaxID=64518 RepID=A0A9P6JE64_MORAP|nr:hypothetical protein BGZ70_003088 [Mortierella alpina]